jgi:hypothetical protein
MDNDSDEDIPNAYLTIQVIEQSDADDASEPGAFYQNQSHFQAEINEGVLTVLFRESLDHLSHKKQRSLSFFDGSCCHSLIV